MLDALARVFDLDAAEHAHLFHLSGVARPVPEGDYPLHAPPELAEVVSGLAPCPAYLLNPRLDVLAWNEGASQLLGDPTPAPDGVPNLVWWQFTEDMPDRPSWPRTQQYTLARFRAAHATRYAHPSFVTLIESLLRESPRFRELWPRHEVLDHQLGTKAMVHPELGELSMHHLQSIPTSHPELRLTQFVPADAATRAALADGARAVLA